jgi:hypothetical protein
MYLRFRLLWLAGHRAAGIGSGTISCLSMLFTQTLTKPNPVSLKDTPFTRLAG